jgi:hypothetical protein
MRVPLPKNILWFVGWLLETRSIRAIGAKLIASLAITASACSLLAEPPLARPGKSASTDSASDLFWPCRPVLSGELIVNELLIRPGGVDLDGDGQSNGRDEALELRLDTTEPVHLREVELLVSGVTRGKLAGSDCLAPGQLLVIVGHTTGPVDLPEGASRVDWPQTLRLPDDGGSVTLVGAQGAELTSASWSSQSGTAGASLVRSADGVWWQELVRHDAVAPGMAHSVGRCSNGQPAAACWPPPEF